MKLYRKRDERVSSNSARHTLEEGFNRSYYDESHYARQCSSARGRARECLPPSLFFFPDQFSYVSRDADATEPRRDADLARLRRVTLRRIKMSEVKIVPAVGGAFQLRAIRARKDL